MAQQTSLRPAAVGRNAAEGILDAGMRAARFTAPVLMVFLILAAAPYLQAESAAAKNNEGNRLFSQGKYEDAEKAYLQAQAKSPGKPEILYNLGNSLIKQKKYDQGVQTLRQSISSPDAPIKKNSWYNTGNALYMAGSFKDSAEAYIQALKLDPKDRDAKHNLEMALKQLRQQQEGKSDKDQDRTGSDQGKTGNSESGKNGDSQSNERNADASAEREQGKEPEEAEGTDRPRPENSIGREQALQILEALENRELDEQRRLLEQRARRKSNEKDW